MVFSSGQIISGDAIKKYGFRMKGSPLCCHQDLIQGNP
ncbi:hypothetical protein ASZ90_014898 [hydrocarbon metagenome]|uniref:Uncharacterized protein n=1 Tax=hydrocarbon metagenome TaxID=938273 RepID=A0A0W8F3H1_9ZZZZ